MILFIHLSLAAFIWQQILNMKQLEDFHLLSIFVSSTKISNCQNEYDDNSVFLSMLTWENKIAGLQVNKDYTGSLTRFDEQRQMLEHKYNSWSPTLGICIQHNLHSYNNKPWRRDCSNLFFKNWNPRFYLEMLRLSLSYPWPFDLPIL